MADRRIDQLTEAEDISDDDLFVIWKENISQTRSIKMQTMGLATKEYVRNQNILSDWETITLSTNSNNPTIMQYDGELIITGNPTSSSTQTYLFLIQSNIGAVSGSQTTDGTVVCVSKTIKKGDALHLEGTNYGAITARARYYKLRDYSNRQ